MIHFLSNTSLSNRRVLLRADFNVPIAGGKIRSDYRIRLHLATIRRLIRGGNRILVLSHHSDPAQSLRPVARRLGRLLGVPVAFFSDPHRSAPLQARERVALLENLRHWRGEEVSSYAFAKVLARHGDAYVNDAFSVAHRAAVSVSVLPELMPAYGGLLLERELSMLAQLLHRPARPLVVMVGGAKIGTKVPLLRRFSSYADRILVGGAIANTLLRARGMPVGRSRVERVPGVHLERLARKRSLVLPVDGAVATRRDSRTARRALLEDIRSNESIFDIGPRTVRTFAATIRSARTVIWNGPLGLAESRRFSRGTRAIARSLLRSRAHMVVGGGDTIAFLEAEKLLPRFKHVSSGGGAMLAYLGGERLPGLEALKKSRSDEMKK